jgi:hypothetical protein
MKNLLQFILFFIVSSGSLFAQIPTNGLVAFYAFSNNCHDSINANNLTNYGLTFTTDRFGRTYHAALLNGSSYALTNNAYLLDTFSVSAWCNPSVLPMTGIVWANGSTNWDGAAVLISAGYGLGSGNNVNFYFGNSGYSTKVDTLHNTNQWVHTVLTYIGGHYQFWVNDVLIDSAYLVMNTPTSPFLVGASYLAPNYQEYFQGAIDDIRIYNRAVNSTEVYELYHESLDEVPQVSSTKNITIYPNPADNYFAVNSSAEIQSIFICNLLGQVIFRTNVTAKSVNINTTTLPSGTYFVEIVFEDDSKEIRKIVKQ